MTPEEKNKVLEEAVRISEEHLRECEDHSFLVDYSIRYGLGKALEAHRNAPVDFGRDTKDPDMWALIDSLHVHFKAGRSDLPPTEAK